jgi:hypothetical protein
MKTINIKETDWSNLHNACNDEYYLKVQDNSVLVYMDLAEKELMSLSVNDINTLKILKDLGFVVQFTKIIDTYEKLFDFLKDTTGLYFNGIKFMITKTKHIDKGWYEGYDYKLINTYYTHKEIEKMYNVVFQMER